MAASADVDQSLRHVKATTRRMADLLRGLPEATWEQTTNCAPWRFRDLVGHVIASGESFRESVERGLAGSVEPPPPGERERHIAELAVLSPDQQIERLEAEATATEQLYERLSADQLETICFHRRGNRPARWYVQHRLAELAFHLWDLEHSLGRSAELDADVAAFLLPMLLESNVPRIYQGGQGKEGRFRLVAEGLDSGSWILAATPERLEVRRDGGAADVVIRGGPAVLARLIYGRADLAEEERAGRLQVEGDRALAGRFNTIFRGP